MTISNYELVEQAVHFGVDLFFENILMSDELMGLALQAHMNIIINSVPSGSREGKHWTMLMVRERYAFHFDSYAGVPTVSVHLFCKKHNLTLCHSKFIIQSMRSTQCGNFCLALLVYEKYEKMERVPPAAWNVRLFELANNFVNLFDADANKNDAILAKYLKLRQNK